MTVEGVIHAAIRQVKRAADEDAFWKNLTLEGKPEVVHAIRSRTARLVRNALAVKLSQNADGPALDVVLRRVEWVNSIVGVAIELSVRADASARALKVHDTTLLREVIRQVLHDAVAEALNLGEEASQLVLIEDVSLDGFTTSVIDDRTAVGFLERSISVSALLVLLSAFFVLVGATAIAATLSVLQPQYRLFVAYQETAEKKMNATKDDPSGKEMPTEGSETKLKVTEFNRIVSNLAQLRAVQTNVEQLAQTNAKQAPKNAASIASNE